MSPRARSSLLPVLVCHAALACRHTPAQTHPDAAAPPPSPSSAPTAPAVPAPPSPPQPPWCFAPAPEADIRAIDTDGTVWSVRQGRLFDETHNAVSELPSERECPARGAWALEFLPDGRAFAVLDSRFYVRRDRASGFAVTPMCTDIAGSPYTPRAEGGYAFVVHTWPAAGLGMMLTNDATGASGWYAITALDRTITAAVLDPQHSSLTLANEGHLIVVDQTQHVAGEVLAAHGALFQGLSRTPAGVVAWRDEGDAERVLVLGDATVGPFVDQRSARPARSHTTAVFRADLARVIAVTDAGIEVSSNRGAAFSSVLRSEIPLERPTLGWLAGRQIAVATRRGVASARCLP